jgi:internalin A
MQPNLAEAERRIEEARRTQAKILDLGDLALSELPASLGDLPHLKALYLGAIMPTETGDLKWDFDRKNPELADLAPLAGLQGLQSLNLSRCRAVADLAPLAGLQRLQSLGLWNTGVTDLAPLAGIKGLKNLDLWSTNVTDLAPLARLQALQRLDLSRTGVTDLTPLAELRGLQLLELVGTSVTDLAPLAGLQGLRSLDLSSTRVKDLAPLAELKGLQNLDLSGTDVANLTWMARLQGLQRLDLSRTSVTDLASLASLQGLQTLDLVGLSVTDLSPLVGLLELRKLDLYGCRPAVPAGLLRVFADHPRLTEVVADEAVGVPREVLSHNYGNNCLPQLRTYFSELDLGAEPENEVKVILLGNGRVGKTQLCRRFRGQPFDESVKSTHGVQIWREELRIRTGGQEQVFHVNWWDFGGQDIYHGTHALFLRSRAVFLILWTPNLENRDEYSEGGIPLRNQPLAYWLDYVRTLAGEDSPVIVVQSQCDRFADRRPSPPRPDGFGFFEGCFYSAKEDLGREALEAHLRDAIRYLLERNSALEIGRGRAKVRRQLYDWRSEDQKQKPEERQHRTLTVEEFRALCDEAGGILSWEHALDYFHQTGVVFYRPDLFSKRIVLDQTWALDAVYTVFHRGRAAPWLRDSGRFTREDLALMAWTEHSLEEQRLFLGLMESCGVCFPCGKTAQGEARYVAPDLLPRFEAVAGRLHAWKDEPGTPTLRLEYRFFHQAFIRGLMNEIGRRAGDLAEYWKYGLWLKDGWRDTQLLLQFVDTSTNDAPGAGALELKAQGRDPLDLLREIRKTISRQRIGEEPEELLTLDGTTVARCALANVIAGRVLDLQKRRVLAAAFAAFFENREPADGTHGIDITPQHLTAREKPREVFISYAWGDETPEGKIRTKAVEGLYSALEKDDFLPVRDRDQIQSGERISAFIRRLTRADLVVAVISDKYLRSPYCMYEIYKLWQKSQGDAADLLQHLVPIVLPEVKIGSFVERAPYLRYWAGQAKSLKALIRKEDLEPSRESWEEVRLVQEFAHHVDDILVFLQDVLIPRKLEAHLDDDFQAVREALRRRLEAGE